MAEADNGRIARGLAPGTRMGRYTLLHRLAVGGMAELYVARQGGIEGFEKIVALKRVLPHLAEDPQFVKMFLDEARFAASLDHPNIAHVTDIGEADGEYFFAMEYVHGANLLEVLRRGDHVPLSLECALTIVVGVAAALHHAHEQLGPDGRPLGLVHRDVSPSNVLISHNGAVKLTDFGIARAAARTSVTTKGQTKGKAGYMSPEQCRGDRLDRRSDIFALGILLYEVTLGVRAFYAPNDFAILGRIARADYIPPHEIDEQYPEPLAAIVARAMAKDPEDRFRTAEEVQVELEEFARDHGLRLSTVELSRTMEALFGSPAHPHTDLGELPPVEPEPTPAPVPVVVAAPSARLPWMLAGAGLATAVATAISLWPRQPPPGAAATPSTEAAVAGPAGVEVDASPPVGPPGAEAPAPTTPEPETAAAGEELDPIDEAAAEEGDEPLADERLADGPTAEPASPRKRRPKKKRQAASADDPNGLYPPGMRP
ncbi:MAG: protein kinase [Myxococcales bacterium]|nr:protein kinase [Myxococcales bacterium]